MAYIAEWTVTRHSQHVWMRRVQGLTSRHHTKPGGGGGAVTLGGGVPASGDGVPVSRGKLCGVSIVAFCSSTLMRTGTPYTTARAFQTGDPSWAAVAHAC
eukprot:GGOE01012834.1.p5 GENE.GGOE01012834.1~~GGOE01012834.1.p5  ORF type:complete len:100 (-),score=8.87 GGOE01012834.1:31-330(-)